MNDETKTDEARKIARTVQGLCEFSMGKIEELEGVDKRDMDIATKTRLQKQLIDNIYKGLGMELSFKKLLIQAPDVARNRDIQIALGIEKPKERTTTDETKTDKE